MYIETALLRTGADLGLMNRCAAGKYTAMRLPPEGACQGLAKPAYDGGEIRRAEAASRR